MKNRSKLVMIEQIIMIAVFAVASTVCVRMFVLSDRISKESKATDKAVLMAQNVAERLKTDGITAYGRDAEATREAADRWVMFYDAEWNRSRTKAENGFCITVQELPTENEFLWTAQITVDSVGGKELFCISVTGQDKDGGDGR